MAKTGADGLGERLQEVLSERSITQGKLAEMIGTSQPAVSQWCSGKKVPTEETISQIERRLGLTPGWLVSGLGPRMARNEAADRERYQAHTGWCFRPAPSDGGRDYGNSNVWSFDPTLDTFVREVLQNARDAALPGGGAVQVTFRLIQLRGDALQEYRTTLGWVHLEAHLRASAKGKQKLAMLLADGLRQVDDQDELLLLVVEDRYTTGLVGAERGDGSKFAALCRNNLDSNKEGSSTRGGAFGLGKAVLWRASRLATVLFGSRLSTPQQPGGSLRLFGRCELSWHQNANDSQAYAGPGWFGKVEEAGAVSCWDNETLAEDLHLSRKTDLGTGTSICVVGFHDPGSDAPRKIDDLADDLKRASARHFFPALARKQLQVTIETYEGCHRTRAEEVQGEQLEPGFWAIFQKLEAKECVTELENTGDVAEATVRLDVARRIVEPTHAECEHDALLLVRQMPDDASEDHRNVLALVRGPGMVVEFQSLGSLCLGARPFQAVLLCGRLGGVGENDFRADEFLRTAEPPAHHKWTMTPDLKVAYAWGAKTKIDRFLARARDKIRELVKPASGNQKEGPQALRELLQLGKETGGGSVGGSDRPTIMSQTGTTDEQHRWCVTVRLRVKASKTPQRLEPVVLFVGETGGGVPVRWRELKALKNCTVEGNYLIVLSNQREVQFTGITDEQSHPVPAEESTIQVDIRKLAGGAV